MQAAKYPSSEWDQKRKEQREENLSAKRRQSSFQNSKIEKTASGEDLDLKVQEKGKELFRPQGDKQKRQTPPQLDVTKARPARRHLAERVKKVGESAKKKSRSLAAFTGHHRIRRPAKRPCPGQSRKKKNKIGEKKEPKRTADEIRRVGERGHRDKRAFVKPKTLYDMF